LQDARRRWRWLAAASLAYGLALGARPSLLFGAVILLVPVARAWREKRPVWSLLLAACGPVVLIGLGLMVYNTLRFDNPLQFGDRYQLPPIAHQPFRLRYVWFNFRVGFLEPARWSYSFPFVHDVVLPESPKGYNIVDHPFGILTNTPIVWLALAAPLAWRSRSGKDRSNLRWFLGAVALFFGMCALTLCLHDSMCLRYELEYASPLLFLAVVGAFALERVLAGQAAWRWAVRCSWFLLLAFSSVFNLCLSFETRGEIHLGEGNVFLQMGRMEEAETQLREALQIDPNLAQGHNNLGRVLLQKGEVDEATAEFQKVVEIQPDYADGHNNLGVVLLQKDAVEEAMSEFQKALEIKPDYAEAHNNLGDVLLQKGGTDEAIAHFQKALETDAGYANAHTHLGTALLLKGRPDQAIAQYQKALEIKPDQVFVLNNLAWLLATTPGTSLRNGAKAVALAAQADQLSGGGDPTILHTLAAAYAEEGNYGRATVTARRGLELAMEQKNDALAAALQKEIKLYEADTPLRGVKPPSGNLKPEN
jgi:tetratricopeptide (TPR) repeat protein